MVDARWIALAVLVLGSALLVKRYPEWAVPVTIAVGVGGLAVTVMFIVV